VVVLNTVLSAAALARDSIRKCVINVLVTRSYVGYVRARKSQQADRPHDSPFTVQ
jgi:hypothetical protein